MIEEPSIETWLDPIVLTCIKNRSGKVGREDIIELVNLRQDFTLDAINRLKEAGRIEEKFRGYEKMIYFLK